MQVQGLIKRIKIKINNFPYIFIKTKTDQSVLNIFKDHKGLEIGGPSRFFSDKGSLSIYPICQSIDIVNFSRETIWDNNFPEFKANCTVKEIFSDGTELKNVKNKYDFVLSCHNLEHIANPLKALLLWKSKIIKGGVIVLVLPDKNYTFDWKREATKFSHIKNDFTNNVNEKDLSHKKEILDKTDLKISKLANSKKEFDSMLSNNYHLRIMHHHVYNKELIIKMAKYCSMEIIYSKDIKPFHQLFILKK